MEHKVSFILMNMVIYIVVYKERLITYLVLPQLGSVVSLLTQTYDNTLPPHLQLT